MTLSQSHPRDTRFVRSIGVQVRRYLVVDLNGQTRSLTEHQMQQRRILLSLYDYDEKYLIKYYPKLENGHPVKDWDEAAVADALKRMALTACYHHRVETHLTLRRKGLRA